MVAPKGRSQRIDAVVAFGRLRRGQAGADAVGHAVVARDLGICQRSSAGTQAWCRSPSPPTPARCRPLSPRPAVAPGRRRCSTPAAAAGQAVNTRLTNEQCAVPYHAVGKREVPRHARPRARRETEKKFAHGLLKGMQRA